MGLPKHMLGPALRRRRRMILAAAVPLCCCSLALGSRRVHAPFMQHTSFCSSRPLGRRTLTALASESQHTLQRAPRVYSGGSVLLEASTVALSPDQLHYLTKVMRLRGGDLVRVFNAKDGEWACRVMSDRVESSPRARVKRARGGASDVSVVVESLLRSPPRSSNSQQELHLCFAPIKRTRLKMMLEKATELGATVLQPVITEYTDLRDDHTEELLRKMEAGVIEAAEQCERLTLPRFEAPVPLRALLGLPSTSASSDTALPPSSSAKAVASLSPGALVPPLYWCREREQAKPLFTALEEARAHGQQARGARFLIGPEGGFSPAEMDMLSRRDNVVAVSLGENVLRAETAAAVALGCYVTWRSGVVEQ